MHELDGKVVAITGGASGIGRALADAFGAQRLIFVKDVDGPGGRVPATKPDLPVNRLACELLPTAKHVREFRVVNGLTRGALTDALARPGARLVASYSPLSRRDEARARELSAALYDQLLAADRPELTELLDNGLLALATKDVDGVDHAAAKELTALVDRAARRGGPRAGIVAFEPEDAPAHLLSG